MAFSASNQIREVPTYLFENTFTQQVKLKISKSQFDFVYKKMQRNILITKPSEIFSKTF